MLEAIKGCRPRVEYILRNYPRSRDCDKFLLIKYMYVFHSLHNITKGSPDSVLWDVVQDAPVAESISRARRLIQNKLGLYRGTKQLERARREAEVRDGINKI